MSTPTQDHESEILALPSLLRRLVVGLFVLALTAYLAGLILRDPITMVSEWIVAQFGYPGIYFGVLILDSIPFTVTEPLLILYYQGGIPFWLLTTIAGLGSWSSALIGYGIGMTLGQTRFIQGVFRRYRIDTFMKRYGTTFVAISAITPFPYSISTWSAGASRIPLTHVLLAALLRFPKNYLYMGLVVAGWLASS